MLPQQLRQHMQSLKVDAEDCLYCFMRASVSEQLDALCDNSPVCAPTRLKRKQAEVQQLRRQLAEKDALVEQLQQLLVAAQSSQRQ